MSNAGESAPVQRTDRHQASGSTTRKTGAAPIAVLMTGGLFAAAAAVGALSSMTPASPARAGILAQVQPAEFNQAIASLDPIVGRQAADDARACRAPLAVVTVAGAPGAVRIRSGAYLSPLISVTATPQRLAVPFPAAYPIGSGTLRVEGQATNMTIFLTPGWNVASLNGVAELHVFWTPKSSC
jgi:hypothetical protein